MHHSPNSAPNGLIGEFVRTDNPGEFIDAFPRLITPTTDESPYFFQFTRWNKPTSAAESIREPTYISQGNPLWIAGLGVYAITLATALLFGPFLLGRRPPSSPGLTRYFAGLGMGYIMVELALMSQLTLLVGHPLRAFGVTLAGMLISSGIGSLQAHRFRSLRWLPIVLVASVAMLQWIIPAVTDAARTWDVWTRCLAALVITTPAGFLLGLPFAHRIDRIPADQIPWAWATNALFSVVGAITVIAVSMTLSFSAVLWGAVLIYAVALLTPDPE